MEELYREQAYEKYINKQRELEYFEDDYHRAKKTFEQRYQDLDERRGLFYRLLDEELDKMGMFVTSAELDSDVMNGWVNQVDEWRNDSEFYFHRQCDQLALEEEECDRSYRKQCERYEEEIDRLRRDYAATL